MMVIQRVARTTNKPFGPLDREIALEITRRGGSITSFILKLFKEIAPIYSKKEMTIALAGLFNDHIIEKIISF